MADRKISELTALTTPATGDLIPIVDVSEAAAADKNKSITVGELLRGAPDGTAAAPGFAFESDGGNGMFLGGTDILAFSTGGNQAITIDASQQVGIGTSAPKRLLHLNGGNETVKIQITNTTTGSGTDGDGFQVGIATDGTAFVEQRENLDLFFSTNNDEKLRIKSDGKVGIGDTAPSEKLNVAGNVMLEGGDQYLYLTNAGTGNSGIYVRGNTAGSYLRSHTTGVFTWETSGNEKMRLDSSGRLLVGTTSARGDHSGNTSGAETRLQIEGTSFVTSSGAFIRNSSDANDAHIFLSKSRGTSVGSTTAVQNNDDLGTLEFEGADGETFITAAEIKAEVDGTPGTDDMPGRLVFSVNSGTTNPTDRMRIVNNGRLDLYSTDAAAWGQFARMVRFGYGSPYKCLMLGGTETATYTSISLGYNVENNASGSFNGDGREIVVRNNARIISPDDDDDAWLPNIYFNMAGHGTINAANGMAFGTDTASTNVLDDYEEGTWQPTVTTGTVGYAFARYTKIGRQVTVAARINTFSDRSSSAAVVVGNLPYATGASNAQAAGSAFFRYVNNEFTVVYVDDTDLLFYLGGAGGFDSMQHQDITDSNAEIYFFATYFTG